MERTTLLGSLFLRASSLYGGAPIGDIIKESLKQRKKGDRRAEKRTSSKDPHSSADHKGDSSHHNEKHREAA
jgi:hypothetical protein